MGLVCSSNGTFSLIDECASKPVHRNPRLLYVTQKQFSYFFNCPIKIPYIHTFFMMDMAMFNEMTLSLGDFLYKFCCKELMCHGCHELRLDGSSWCRLFHSLLAQPQLQVNSRGLSVAAEKWWKFLPVAWACDWGNHKLYLDQSTPKGWCHHPFGIYWSKYKSAAHASYPTDSPTVTSLGLFSGLLLGNANMRQATPAASPWHLGVTMATRNVNCSWC